MTKAEVALIADEKAPAKARELLARVLAGQVAPDALSHAQLALSEVVSNAVRHGTETPADHIEVKIRRTPGVVTVNVRQTRAIPPLAVQQGVTVEPPATGGWGLGIVDKITSRWGVEPDPPSVWFELEA